MILLGGIKSLRRAAISAAFVASAMMLTSMPRGVGGVASAPFLEGAYNPQSDVNELTDLVSLVAQIKNADDETTRESLYTTNAGFQDGLTLQQLSLNAGSLMRNDVMFNFYLFALWDDDVDNADEMVGGLGYTGLFDDEPLTQYADTIVGDALEIDSKLSSDGILILNVYMYMLHKLYTAVNQCRDGLVSTSPDYVNPIDEAAALWIGKNQGVGSADGASLYAIAEEVGEKFSNGGAGDTQVSTVNTKILELLNAAQTNLNACRTSSDKDKDATDLRFLVDDVMRYMAIPLIQNVYRYMDEEDANMVELYGLAMLPIMVSCNDDTYDNLYDMMVDTEYDKLNFDTIVESLQSIYRCIGIRCADVGTYTGGSKSVSCQDEETVDMAGYSPASPSIKQLANIDLDISDIDTLMDMQAYDAALDVYKYGRHVKETSSSYKSLADIASDFDDSVDNEVYDSFSTYYGVNNKADEVAREIIKGEGPFSTANVPQREEGSVVVLSTMVLVMSAVEKLYSAIAKCKLNSVADARKDWDTAVAYLVGSLEGPDAGGSEDLDGYLLYGYAKLRCDEYDVCDADSENAAVNRQVMEKFNEGAAALSVQGNCLNAENFANDIVLLLQVPLIENTLHYAELRDHVSENEEESPALLVEGYVASQAVLPFVDNAYGPSADTIKEHMKFPISATGTLGGVPYASVDFKGTVYGAFQEAIVNMGVDCSLISRELCANSPQPPSDSYTLGSGVNVYTPYTDVKDLADLSLVVEKMRGEDDEEKVSAMYYTETAGDVSFSSMSIDAKTLMMKEPLFNLYRWALWDDSDEFDDDRIMFDDEPASQYADTVVSDALETDLDLAREGMLILNLWMFVAHKLYSAVDECKGGVIHGDLPSYVNPIDEAAALWIGNGVPGAQDSSNGNLLLALAREAGANFDQSTGVDDIGSVNIEIMASFSEAQKYFRNGDEYGDCVTNTDDAFKSLRILVDDIVRQMTIPLVQNFIHYMVEHDDDAIEQSNMVELYGFALLPQVSTCGNNDFDKLYEMVIDVGYGDENFTSIVETLQSNYNCMGLSCNAVGEHTSGTVPQCVEAVQPDIAGYSPTSPRARQASKLDLDMVALYNLMDVSAYDAARDIYQYGRNFRDGEDNYVSLYEIANGEFHFVGYPLYDIYDSYFGEAPGLFAHDIVMDAIDRKGRFTAADYGERQEAVTSALPSIALFIAALDSMQYAIEKCSSDTNAAQLHWDDAVAFLVGSIEGPEPGGEKNEDGYFLYSMGKYLCDWFGDCTQSGDAEVNVQLMSKFNSGISNIKSGDCIQAGNNLDDIAKLLEVPLIQTTLYYAEKNDNLGYGDDDSDDYSLPYGYVIANSILPLVDDVNEAAASTIATNMEFPKNILDADSLAAALKGSFTVYGAFRAAIPDMGVDCDLVSSDNRYSICSDENDVDKDPDSDGLQSGNDPNPTNADANSNGVIDANEDTDSDGLTDGAETNVHDTNPNAADTDGDGLTDNEEINTHNTDSNNADSDSDGKSDGDEVNSGEDPNEAGPIDPDAATYLSNGLYVTTNYVADRSAIALDIKSIENALKVNNPQLAIDIYESGENSQPYDDEGRPTSTLRTIKGFSTTAAQVMAQDPTFNIYKNALGDGMYADTFVTEAFGISNPKTLAAEAMIALNIWMQVIHKLHQTNNACKASVVSSSRSLAEDDVSLLLDEVAAYWIGDSQQTGSSEEGHLLYAMTEEVGSKFGQEWQGQAMMNRRIIVLLNEAKNHIAITQSCSSTNQEAHVKLRMIVDRIISLMTVPLMQNLIRYLRVNDKNRVKLYALSVVPLLSTCNPPLFEELRVKLIDADFDFLETDQILGKLERSYSCFGITCAMVGSYEDGEIPQCTDSDKVALAGFIPLSDVREHAKIDLDISHIGMFINNAADDAALDYYLYGHHSKQAEEHMTLHELATTSLRSLVPQYNVFRRYFDNDNDYAHTMILDAINGAGRFVSATKEQRSLIVTFALRFMVLYMYSLREMYDARQDCQAGSATSGTIAWDQAAAFIIGSMEGTQNGGSENGHLLFGLAKRLCERFGTCAASGNAKINEELVTLLYAGQAELSSGNCDALRKTIEKIEPLLQVPLIQGTLELSWVNENALSSAPTFAEGYVLSQSIVPLVDESSEKAATDIDRVMKVNFPVNDFSDVDFGSNDVFAAFKDAIPGMKGVQCEDVGSLDGRGVCEGDADNSGNTAFVVVPVTLVSMFVAILLL